MRYLLSWLIIILLTLAGVGCEVLPEARPIPETAFGMAPVYADSTTGRMIASEAPRGIIEGRDFVILGDTLYIVDQLIGIHVLDNTDPGSPIPIAFLNIPGCASVAIIGNFLYTNNLRDLVTLDVTDPLNVTVVDREENLYPSPLDYPESYSGFFSCYDPSLGFLVGWELKEIELPECFVQ